MTRATGEGAPTGRKTSKFESGLESGFSLRGHRLRPSRPPHFRGPPPLRQPKPHDGPPKGRPRDDPPVRQAPLANPLREPRPVGEGGKEGEQGEGESEAQRGGWGWALEGAGVVAHKVMDWADGRS